jgi:hypothetical protein
MQTIQIDLDGWISAIILIQSLPDKDLKNAQKNKLIQS